MQFTRKALGVGVLALAMASSIAACGGDDSKGGTTTAAGPKLTGKPVLFGHAAAYSKEAAFLGPAMRSGIDLAIDEVNGHGGIDGRPVKLKVADTEGSEQTAVTAISKLVDVDHVSALVGPTSMEIFAVIDMLKEKGVPTALVAGASDLDTKMGGKTMWRLFPSDSIFAPVIAKYAVDQHLGAIGALFEDQESAQGLKKSIDAALQADGGQIARSVDPAVKQSDYRAEAAQAFKSPVPGAYLYQMAPETASTFWQNAAEVSPSLSKITLIGNDTLMDRESLDALGPALSQIRIRALTPIPAGPADKYYERRYEQKYDKDTPDAYSANTYDATVLYALAAIAAKDPSRKGIATHMDDVAGPPGKMCTTFAACKDLLKEGQEINYEGASGSMNFDARGNVLGPFGVFEYKDGKLQQTATIDQRQVAQAVKEGA
jgi:branched-chain amino acid transport system substrate-binding protein